MSFFEFPNLYRHIFSYKQQFMIVHYAILFTCCREFNLVMFPNHDIISPEADFLVYSGSADSPRRANFDPSVLYKGILECKEMLLCHVDV